MIEAASVGVRCLPENFVVHIIQYEFLWHIKPANFHLRCHQKIHLKGGQWRRGGVPHGLPLELLLVVKMSVGNLFEGAVYGVRYVKCRRQDLVRWGGGRKPGLHENNLSQKNDMKYILASVTEQQTLLSRTVCRDNLTESLSDAVRFQSELNEINWRKPRWGHAPQCPIAPPWRRGR